MAETLRENGDPVEINGVVLRTPGLRGTVEVFEPPPGGMRSEMRGEDDLKKPLIDAFLETGTTEMLTIEISDTEEIEMANVQTRSDRHDEPAIEVTVPAPAEDFG